VNGVNLNLSSKRREARYRQGIVPILWSSLSSKMLGLERAYGASGLHCFFGSFGSFSCGGDDIYTYLLTAELGKSEYIKSNTA